MACPHFYPVEKFPEAAWHKHPRMPLGDPYLGTCRADPVREWTPDDQTLRVFCNLGYARHKCRHFPKKSGGPDAFRFTILNDQEGIVSLFYVAEEGHTSLRHGTMEISLGGELLASEPADTFNRQIRAYIESYLRRKHDPENDEKSPHRR